MHGGSSALRALQTFALDNLGLTVAFCGSKAIAPLWFYTHSCNIHKQLDLKWSVKDVLNNLSLVRQVAPRELVATQSKQKADFFSWSEDAVAIGLRR